MSGKAVASIIAALTGSAAPYLENSIPLRIPPIAMDIFQCIAWGSAGVIAIITFLKYLKDKKNEK